MNLLCMARGRLTIRQMGVPRALRPIVDFALPPRCAGCGLIVEEDDSLCVICWQSLTFLTDAGCDACGADVPAGVVRCARCLQHSPNHDGVRAAVVYDEVSRHIALRLKHGRRIGLSRQMARAMARVLPGDTDLLVPVPLHRWRLWSRGFNQSALVARHLSAQSRVEAEMGLLKRIKHTPLLRGLTALDRSKAVRGAFSVVTNGKSRVKGRTIALIDDVYTSGATANACAKALKRAGALRVYVVSWARVPLGGAMD